MMIERKKNLKNPISRQNFANAFAQTHNLNLELRHNRSVKYGGILHNRSVKLVILHIPSNIVNFCKQLPTRAWKLKENIVFF